MALDFPSSPTVGQKHPATPIAGVPNYTWDGEKWTSVAPGIQGPAGPQGPPGQWVQLTQAQYNALSPPVAGTLYVIIG